MDYIFFTINSIHDYQIEKLEKIQNKAIRLIYNQKYDCPTDTLREIAKTNKVEDRLKELLEKYYIKASNNKKVTQLQEEYLTAHKRFKNSINQIKTPLCDFLIPYV